MVIDWWWCVYLWHLQPIQIYVYRAYHRIQYTIWSPLQSHCPSWCKTARSNRCLRFILQVFSNVRAKTYNHRNGDMHAYKMILLHTRSQNVQCNHCSGCVLFLIHWNDSISRFSRKFWHCRHIHISLPLKIFTNYEHRSSNHFPSISKCCNVWVSFATSHIFREPSLAK